MAFKTGDSVKVKYTTTTNGVVEGATVDSESNLLLRVSYTDQVGTPQERFFKEDELEAA
jgi:uncharacterized protein YodC (DUF2158 family)